MHKETKTIILFTIFALLFAVGAWRLFSRYHVQISKPEVEAQTTPRLIQPSDLRFDGAYRLTNDSLGSARGGLAYRPSTNTYFTIGNETAGSPLLEIRLPTAAPSTSTSTAPQATLVKNWGTTLWSGHVVFSSAGDKINSLWYDTTKNLLWVSFGDFYSVPTTANDLLAVDVSVDPPIVYGPWTNSIYMRRAWSQCLEAPASLQAITNKRFVCSGDKGSTGQSDSWGPNMIALQEPTLSAATHTAFPAQELMFWGMVTDSINTPFGVSHLTRSNYPRSSTWTWIEAFGSSSSYQGSPYYEIPISNLWNRMDYQGMFVWVDESDVKGILFFGQECQGAGWYGAPDEVSNTTKSSQLIPSIKFPSYGNGYAQSHQGGSRGTHCEYLDQIVRFIDPGEIIKAAQGQRNIQVSHYVSTSIKQAWPAYTANDSIRPETRGVYYDKSSRKIYFITNGAYGNNPQKPAIYVFTVLSGGTTPPPTTYIRTIQVSPQGLTSKVVSGQLSVYNSSKVLQKTYAFSTNASGVATITFDIPAATGIILKTVIPKYLDKVLRTVDLNQNVTYNIGTNKSGDLNADNIVNSVDFSLLNSKWFQSDSTKDLNNDGTINSVDFSLMKVNWFVTGEVQ